VTIPALNELEEIFSRFTHVEMQLNATGWWDPIPSASGWYLIETNTPLTVMEQLPPPPRGGILYNIPERLNFSKFLRQTNLAIIPSTPGASFVIYSGEHGNLKSRAREHTHGHPKTGCLCLSQYPHLYNYSWSFSYLSCDSVFLGCQGDKALRALVEQKWRGKYGWPLLCKE
jgi:hypothetical protein